MEETHSYFDIQIVQVAYCWVLFQMAETKMVAWNVEFVGYYLLHVTGVLGEKLPCHLQEMLPCWALYPFGMTCQLVVNVAVLEKGEQIVALAYDILADLFVPEQEVLAQ